MTTKLKLILIVSFLTCGVAFGKAKIRKPSSEGAVDCTLSSETKGDLTGNFLLIAGEREDDGVWIGKISIYEHLASLQDQGICKNDKKVIPVSCKVMSDKVENSTLHYVSVEGAGKEESGAWSSVPGAMGYLADLQKKGVCK